MSVNISYDTDISLDIPDYEDVIRDVIEKALEVEGCPYATEVNVTIADDDYIKEINTDFRGINNATDVLSFPAIEYDTPGDFESLKDYLEENDYIFFNPDSGELIFGDIIISANKVIDQAKEYGHSGKRELAFLVAHSMLHLSGYDHEEPADAEIMEKKQDEILNELGITRDI